MAKKRSKSGRKVVNHENNAKAVLAFLVLVVAFGVFWIFNNNQESIINSSSLQFFLILVVVLFALLIGLLYLMNPQKK